MLPTGFLTLLLFAMISWRSTTPLPLFRGRPPSMLLPPLVLTFLAATALVLFFRTLILPVADAGCRLYVDRAILDDFDDDAKPPLELDPLPVSRVSAWKIPPPPPMPIPEDPIVPFWTPPPPRKPRKPWKPGQSILRPIRSSHVSEWQHSKIIRRTELKFDDTVLYPRTKVVSRWMGRRFMFARKAPVHAELEDFMRLGKKLRPLPPLDGDGDVVMEL
ncbi:hypothetical protein GTA08_BOTSDO02560 [Botryosphaeria dothidea]|uniref:Uncharacterized protein n=1 Tax=Botryosphaeria dothidea TaxID=55169 RepID=A0A8H4N473_9PEZI|nr:hypothetical protein GTA08_BOTSDO02560 [Botryosphaeria dothidea]